MYGFFIVTVPVQVGLALPLRSAGTTLSKREKAETERIATKKENTRAF